MYTTVWVRVTLARNITPRNHLNHPNSTYVIGSLLVGLDYLLILQFSIAAIDQLLPPYLIYCQEWLLLHLLCCWYIDDLIRVKLNVWVVYVCSMLFVACQTICDTNRNGATYIRTYMQCMYNILHNHLLPFRVFSVSQSDCREHWK